MKTVCFSPMAATSWTEMTSLALALQDQGLAHPVMLVLQSRTDERRADGVQAGLDCRRLEVEPGLIQAMGWSETQEEPSRLGDLARRGLARLLPRVLERQESARWRDLLGAQKSQALGFLGQLKPSCLVTSDGRMPNWELPLLAACQELGIPVVVPPIALAGDRYTLTRRRRGPQNHAELHPRLWREHPAQAVWDPKQGRHVLYYPAPLLPVLHELGLLPPNPWLLGGGLVDLVLVESRRALGERLEQGQDPERVMVTGHLGHDVLFAGYDQKERLRRELIQAHGLEPREPLVLVALPQLGEHGTLGWERHWQEIRFLAQTLGELPAQVLISLHPKMDPAAYAFLEEEYGLRLAHDRLSGILPAADLFMASYSSTVPWATLCRVPALVFDFYNIDFKLFDDLPGVVKVTARQDLAPEATKILTDARWRESLRQAQEKGAPALSPFDGRCGQRILEAILGARRR